MNYTIKLIQINTSWFYVATKWTKWTNCIIEAVTKWMNCIIEAVTKWTKWMNCIIEITTFIRTLKIMKNSSVKMLQGSLVSTFTYLSMEIQII